MLTILNLAVALILSFFIFKLTRFDDESMSIYIKTGYLTAGHDINIFSMDYAGFTITVWVFLVQLLNFVIFIISERFINKIKAIAYFENQGFLGFVKLLTICFVVVLIIPILMWAKFYF